MVAEWRHVFASPLLPWFTVQLAPYWSLPPGGQDIPIGTNYPHTRVAQANAMIHTRAHTDNTSVGASVAPDMQPLSGYAVTHDLGDHAGGIHPHNKTEVGRRLAMPMRRLVFNATDVWNDGVPSTATDAFVTGATDMLRVVFNTSGGVTWGKTQNCTTCCTSSLNTTFAGASLEVAGADMSDWTLLLASSVGEAVEIRLPAGFKASYVRYAWSNYPQCVLFDAQQLPVPPFKGAVRRVAS
jgi:hypothetical protein